VERTKRWGALRGIVGFVCGIIFALVFQTWFVTLLPGPKASVSVTETKVPSGPTVGCITYSILFETDQPIDYSDVKIQFPNRVTDFRIAPPTVLTAGVTPSQQMDVFVTERQPGGECAIAHPRANREDFQIFSSGNVLTFRTFNLPGDTHAFGMAITNDYESTISPTPTTVTFEGRYKYTKLGQPVEKKLAFRYQTPETKP
jgi:hypothetical protein